MPTTLARLFAAITLVIGVVACSSPSASVTSVVIDGGDQSTDLGSALTLTATVATTGAASDAVVWESSDESVATIDMAANVTSFSVGATSITATSTVDATKSDTIVLTVDPRGVLEWTRQFGTSALDAVTGIATAETGEVYVTGLTLGSLDGLNAGDADAFVRSYASDGTLRWARQFGTGSYDEGRGVASDANGNVYVVGNTAGDLDGSFVGSLDVFIRSYTSAGDLRWTRQFGTVTIEEAIGVATDADGNVYVAGQTLGALEGPNAGGADAFIRSYDGDGTLRWTRQYGTGELDVANRVATDTNGVVYVTGFTRGALDGANAGGLDAYVRSYEGDGSFRWAHQFGTSEDDLASDVATDANGNVNVGGHTLGALAGANAGGEDAFIRSYDRDGTLRWTRQFGTGSDDFVSGVATDTNGNVYAAGYTFGALEGPSAGLDDAFLRAYDRDGNVHWTRQFGTSDIDGALAIATDANANVYAAGGTYGDLEGAGGGEADAFVRKFAP